MLKSWMVLLLCCFPFLYLTAQKQGNIWYFGNFAGLDFNTTPPSPLGNGKLNTREGCSTISDDNGKLLFYTDGITVYNKNNEIMSNGSGLLGDPSATQSAIIIPWPGTNHLYYIITADAMERQNKNGYNYSLVDLSKNNGLGEVTLKNQLLYKPSTEKLTVSLHCNGRDWWIITKQFGNNLFNSYLVDHGGLHTTPVISAVGASLTTEQEQTMGGLTISPDGKKLAMMAISYSAAFRSQIYDFDNATGLISNAVLINGSGNYMAEFSPNSKYLYISSPFKYIKQYDLSYNRTALLEANSIELTPPNTFFLCYGLKIAPDGKIYIAKYDSPILDVITNPNEKGLACNYKIGALELSNGGMLMLPNTLPNFLSSSFHVSITKTIVDPCKRLVQLEATVEGNVSNISYEWIFEDGATSNDKSLIKSFDGVSGKTVFNAKLKVIAEGIYCSNLINQTKEEHIQISFAPLPIANAGTDTMVAEQQPLQLNGAGGISYEWSPAQYLTNSTLANPIATLPAEQTFTLKVTNADGCVDEDQVHIKVYKGPTLYVPTGFSPNGDGKNDILSSLPAGIQLENFSVYNRWGNLVFSTTDYKNGWNGYYKGKKQPEGTYVWIAKGTDFKGQKVLRKGTVYLMR